MTQLSPAPPIPPIDPGSASLARDLAYRIRDETKLSQPKIQAWHRQQVRAAEELICAYCRAPLQGQRERRSVVDLLVPKHLGGPVATENMVLCCPSCSTRKKQLDIGQRLAANPVGLNPAADSLGRLTARRIAVLQSCVGHLTPHKPGVALPVIEEHLVKRWSHPRLAVFAAHREPVSFIGWSTRSGPGDALGVALAALRFQHQGVAVDHGVDGVTLVALPPSQFLAAVWELIELHALVTPLLAGVEPDLEQDWRHGWRYQVTGLPTLRSRRVARGLTVPGPPRSYSDTPEAVKLRAQRAKENARGAYEAAERCYQEMRLSQPGADPREIWLQRVEVNRLYKIWWEISGPA